MTLETPVCAESSGRRRGYLSGLRAKRTRNLRLTIESRFRHRLVDRQHDCEHASTDSGDVDIDFLASALDIRAAGEGVMTVM